jgi:TolB-like protein
MSLFEMLKQRHVFRTALAYVITSWLLIEVMELMTGAFGAPEWVLKVFIGLLAIGIVPTVILSWLYEITPEGIKKDDRHQPEQNQGTARRLNVAILVLLLIAIGLFVQQRMTSEPPVDSKQTTSRQSDGPAMLAVLPFSSKSLDGESDFFASGVHDDLLTQLAKLESLRIISRTSVLEYRNTTLNLREIGERLGADAILEGGVQTAGGRIRINAQLIDANTDEHLWAETYDRELSPANIFDVQQEIARAIASSLNSTLTDQDDQQLSQIPTKNMAAYRAYHRAMEIRRNKDMRLPSYVEALEEAVALDPSFVRAWADLVGIYGLRNVGNLSTDTAIAEKVESALAQIETIAPDSAEALIAQSYYLYYILRDYDHAYDMVVRALKKNPSDSKTLELKSWIMRRQGRLAERAEIIRQIMRLDPESPGHQASLINNLYVTHEYAAFVEEIDNFDDRNRLMPAFGLSYQLLKGATHEQALTFMQQLREPEEWVQAFLARNKLWTAAILNRDYNYAVGMISDIGQLELVDRDSLGTEMMRGLAAYWLLNDQEQLARFISVSNARIVRNKGDNDEYQTIRAYLEIAYLRAIEGKTEESTLHLERWMELASNDYTEHFVYWDLACKTLGINNAVSEAVACIRNGLNEPSFVFPLIEPYLPFYDAMRNEPEFKALLSDIAREYQG